MIAMMRLKKITGENIGSVTCHSRRDGWPRRFRPPPGFAGHVLKAGEVDHDRVADAPEAHQRQRRHRPAAVGDPGRAVNADRPQKMIDEPRSALYSQSQTQADATVGTSDGRKIIVR